MRRTGEADRARLHETFTSLCRVASPSGNERACADWVAAELRGIGLDVDEDDAGPRAGANSGNLFARIERQRSGGRGEGEQGGAPGEGARDGILLCAHLDTVPPIAPIEPVLVDGGWENANAGILGADNKAAVAVLIELARRLQRADRRPLAGVELLFTVSEENGLHGASAFAVGRLRSRFGYVFDHASPIGEIVLASPSHHRLTVDFYGRAAHAGLRPEDGRSAIAAAANAIAAMQLGRLDEHTTANVGMIEGGTAGNVVPERCRVLAEARSLDAARVEAVITEMVDHVQDAAGAAECDADVTVDKLFSGYRTKPSAEQVVIAERALRDCGYEPSHIVTGGGSDANAFELGGFACTNLANGTERNHEPGERVSADALEGMLEVAIALVERAAE